ncbi:MAG: MarR family transcriptional regulator [Prolixibacteraceae bacterium]|nr:MarR family transcriptional regulator [Prolixibacteraceae bacterium]
MKNKYAVLKQVIDLYEDYELENKHLNLYDFVRWMTTKLNEEPEPDETKTSKISAEAGIPLINQFDDKARFLETTARIARYHEFYTRKALKDLVINTRLEYLFLQTIDKLEKAKKTDLINIYHLEYTTGMDTIRRLINNGLLYEIQDESDKRIKLLVLSDFGKDILAQSNKRMNDESTMFFTAISDNKWKKVLPVLEEIDEFHDSVYQKHSNKPFAELSNLMDSLRHLFK